MLPAPVFFSRNVQLPSNLLGRSSGAPGPLEKMPANLLGSPETGYFNGRGIETPSNTHINQAVRVVADKNSSGTISDLDGNLDPGCLHWSTVSDDTLRKYRDPLGHGMLIDAPRNTKSISQMNFWLKSIPGRCAFGKDADLRRFRETWTMTGVLQTYTEPQNVGNRAERVVTFTGEKRARMPNFAAAEGKIPLVEGNYLFVIGMRHELDGPKEDIKCESGEPTVFFGDKTPATRIPQTYWQLHVVMLPGRTYPCVELYTNSQWTGDYWYIGRITGVFPKRENALIQRSAAQAALFPEFEDAEYHRRETVKLDELEVFQSVK